MPGGDRIEHSKLVSIHPFAHVGPVDPGSVGARKGWIDTTIGPPYRLFVRNAANTAWEVVGDATEPLVVEDVQDIIGAMIKATGGQYLDSANTILVPLSPIALSHVYDGDQLLGVEGPSLAGGASATATSTAVGSAGSVVNVNPHSPVWMSSPPVAGQVLTLDVGFAPAVLSARVVQNPDGDHTATTVAVEYSTNNIDWLGAVSAGVTAPDSGYLYFDVGVVTARYWRFTALDGGTDGWEVLFVQLRGIHTWSLVQKGTLGQLWTTTVDGPEWASPTYPVTATVPANELYPLTGSSSVVVNTRVGQPYNMEVNNPGVADGDTYGAGFTLAAGDYLMTTCGVTASNRGRLAYHIDGILVASAQDWYSGGDVENVQRVEAVTVPVGGAHTLRVTIDGKNPSSGDYVFALSATWFRPTTIPGDALYFRGSPVFFEGSIVEYSG